MKLASKRVLVTGAGGFIGSHLAEVLVGLGARTRAMVRYNSLGSWGWLDDSPRAKDMEVVQGDVRDRDSARRAVEGMDCVFHLAALIAIPYSYEAPDSYVETNVKGTMNMLQAARDAGVARFVHTSTSEVYGTAQYVPIDEKHPLQGQSPYAASKIGADKIAEAYHCSFGLPVVTVRPFNTYGPRQSARAIVPTIVTQCLAGGPVRLGNTTPTRDLNFVADTAQGFVAAAQADGAVGTTMNLGSGTEISVGKLAARIGRLIGVDLEVEADPARVRPAGSEVERLLASDALARSSIGWAPEVSLDEGLQRTIEWIRAHAGRFRTGRYQL